MSVLLAVALGMLIGLSLGALGGGGSILTVPALVYAVGLSAQAATTGSLVIVGITAAVAVVGHARAGQVQWGAGLAFGVTGVLASLLGTRLDGRVSPGALLVSFAALMIVAATAMLARTMVPARPSELADDHEAAQLRAPAHAGARTTPVAPPMVTPVPGTPCPGPAPAPAPAPAAARSSRPPMLRTAAKVLAAGLVVGFLTGFLGVGGGFIIVPALVLSLRYEMPTAVGTSLLVISLNSGIALLARGGQGTFHWAVIVPFTLAAIAGSGAGRRVADKTSGASLTRAFAVLLLAVAGYVLVRILLDA